SMQSIFEQPFSRRIRTTSSVVLPADNRTNDSLTNSLISAGAFISWLGKSLCRVREIRRDLISRFRFNHGAQRSVQPCRQGLSFPGAGPALFATAPCVPLDI